MHLKQSYPSRSAWFAVVIAGFSQAQALAQAPAGAKTSNAATMIVVTIGPAAAPVPALRYTLLPPEDQLIHGNAAPILLRQVYEQGQKWRDEIADAGKYIEDMQGRRIPLADLPVEEMQTYFGPYQHLLSELRAAARRDHCQWEYTLESQPHEMVRLGDAQFMRAACGRLLAAKARFDIRQGHLDEALRTMQSGFALSRHVASAPFLVSALIGMAISNMHHECLVELVQQPGAPNLYWAIAQLPDPLCSLSAALILESRFVERKFPALKQLDHLHSTEDWARLSQAIRHELRETNRLLNPNPTPLDSAEIQRVEAILDRPITPELVVLARGYLVRTGHCTEEQAMQMSQPELEIRYSRALWREQFDALRRWFLLPYSQAHARAEAEEQRMDATKQEREWLPLGSMLMATTLPVMKAQAQNRRALARVQVIEALRMHLADAGGKLPARLDEVTAVPVPLDPATGGPFAYRLEGDEAILDVTDLAGLASGRMALIFPTRIRVHSK